MVNKLLCFMSKKEKEKLRNIVNVLEHNDYLYKVFSLLEIKLIVLKKLLYLISSRTGWRCTEPYLEPFQTSKCNFLQK